MNACVLLRSESIVATPDPLPSLSFDFGLIGSEPPLIEIWRIDCSSPRFA